MSKRLETQLEELKAVVVEREKVLAEMQARDGARIKAAEAKSEEARAAAEKLEAVLAARRREIETANEICVFKHIKRKATDDDAVDTWDWDWHPKFLKRVAALVGVHHNDRASVDPKNTHDSLYEAALHALRSSLFGANLELQKLDRRLKEAYQRASDARSAIYSVNYAVSGAEQTLRRAQFAVTQLEQKIRERDATKKLASNLGTSKTSEAGEADEKAKAARAKLRAIIEGKLKLP